MYRQIHGAINNKERKKEKQTVKEIAGHVKRKCEVRTKKYATQIERKKGRKTKQTHLIENCIDSHEWL